MKIAFVYDPLYPYVIGGGEKRYWEMARRLVKYNHDVYLVGMKYWKGYSKIVSDGVKLVGVCPSVSLYNSKGRRSYFEAIYFGVSVFFHLVRNRYDIIDCGNFPYFSCIFARFVTFFRKTKFVITWHEIWGKKQWVNYAGKIGIIGWFIEKIVSRSSRYNIFVSEFMRQRAVEILGIKADNTVIVPNGVDYPALKSVTGDSKTNQIIYVGRLIKTKRVDILVDAFDVVSEKFPDYVLKIIGDGPERNALEQKVKSLRVSKKVLFAGFLEKEGLEKEIKKSKIFVLPSEREGMGIVIVEAMALGTPVIALDAENSAAKTIITNGSDGILVKDTNEMKEAIIRLLTDKELYGKLIENGYKTASDYDWDRVIVPQTIRYYRSND